jgi:hypothetical protein
MQLLDAAELERRVQARAAPPAPLLSSAVCGRQLPAEDQQRWSEALRALGELQARHALGAEELAAAVGARLARAARDCEDCRARRPSYGLAAERKLRWCGGCAKALHPAAVDLNHRKCEDCHSSAPSWALPGSQRRRWCTSCSAAHAGAVDMAHLKCEDCGLVAPSWKLASDGLNRTKRRWCRLVLQPVPSHSDAQ